MTLDGESFILQDLLPLAEFINAFNKAYKKVEVMVRLVFSFLF
jgi:hypothetical protein